MIDEYAWAASGPMYSWFHRATYWIGTVTPTGIARFDTPTITASTRRGRLFVTREPPEMVVLPRPIENRIADRPRVWIKKFTRSLSAIGMPCDFANWLL